MKRLLLAIAVAWVLTGCGATTTKLTFRSPPASWLVFSDPEGQELGRVTFPADLALPQLASPEDAPSYPLTGHLRVNELIEEARVPSSARPFMVPDQGGVGIKVKGFWQVYGWERTAREELAVNYVDVSTDVLLQLLEGKAVEVEGKNTAGKPIWKLFLGLETGR